MSDKHLERCPKCGRKQRRSNQANARYWLLLHKIAEALPRNAPGSFSADTWHVYAKSRFLGCDDVKLPGGKTLTIPRSTASLDTGEFNEYMTKTEQWANEHGIWLDEIENAA